MGFLGRLRGCECALRLLEGGIAVWGRITGCVEVAVDGIRDFDFLVRLPRQSNAYNLPSLALLSPSARYSLSYCLGHTTHHPQPHVADVSISPRTREVIQITASGGMAGAYGAPGIHAVFFPVQPALAAPRIARPLPAKKPSHARARCPIHQAFRSQLGSRSVSNPVLSPHSPPLRRTTTPPKELRDKGE